MSDRPILVTGTARSGVSLVAGAIEHCGAWGGNTVRALRADNHGSFENVDIRDNMVRQFLRGIRADPNGQSPLPEIDKCREVASKIAPWWRRKITRVLLEQGQRSDARVFFASPLSCLMWPVWDKAYPAAQWIIVRRDDEEIITSCERTGYMTGYDTREGWQGWIDMHKWRFTEMATGGLDIWQIWPGKLLKGKLAPLEKLVSHLGLDWQESSVHDYLAPYLWKEGVFELKQ